MSVRARGVWKPKGLRIVLSTALAGALWLAGGGTASAGEFAPAFDVSVSNANAGVRANTTFVQSVPAGNHLIDSINTFIPIDWQIASGSTYPGENVGQVAIKADKGCNGSVDTLTAGSLINQPLDPQDPYQAEWRAVVDATWELIFTVEETTQPHEWLIAVTLDNGTMPAGMCAPLEMKVTVNGSASGGALVIANPTQAGTYLWEEFLLSVSGPDGTHIASVSDNVEIGTDTDADGLANAVDPDDDNDGGLDTMEAHAGTGPLLFCSADNMPNNEALDARLTDLNDDRSVTGFDLNAVASVIGSAVPPAPVRRDIAPDPAGDNNITGADLNRVASAIGTAC